MAKTPLTQSRPERKLLVEGTRWRVYEHTINIGRDPIVTLVFESDSVVRRIRTFPVDWISLDDAVLFALAERL